MSAAPTYVEQKPCPICGLVDGNATPHVCKPLPSVFETFVRQLFTNEMLSLAATARMLKVKLMLTSTEPNFPAEWWQREISDLWAIVSEKERAQ